MKRFICVLLLVSSVTLHAFSQVINDTQIFNPDSDIYLTAKQLQMETQVFFFTQNTPISAGELKMYLKQIDYASLSEQAKVFYDELDSRLNRKVNLLTEDVVQFYINPRVTVEGYYKSNENIPWTNYTYFKDNVLSAPTSIGFGNLFSIQSDFFLGKNYIAMQKDDNFTNIPLKIKDFEYFFPTYAYGSTGKTFDNWGYNLHVGKQGKTIGDTLTGSLIFNKTFETDSYTEFSLFSNFLKYSFDLVHVSSNRMDEFQGDNTDRFMYLHQYDIRLFKKFKFSVIEGTLVANPLQLRYFNPLVFMHQYGGRADVSTPDSTGKYKDNYDIYRETNSCAYFAAMLEFLPVKNTRFYTLFSQVELQLPYERAQARGRYYPNSIGVQSGAEYNLYLKDKSVLNFAAEGVFTSPYLYVKQVPSSSLYRVRTDMQTKQSVYSWIGSPFGPDCLAGQFKINYKPNKKLECEFDYVISAKGNNDFDMFNETYEWTESDSKKKAYSYYPSVLYYLIQKGYPETYDELYEQAIDLSITGIPVITNQFCLKTSYAITTKLTVNGKCVYTYVVNNNHVKNEKESGVELALSLQYKLFD